tara:strand:+ start:143 stop:850 length:708 start_codon:yes stop_codon:yes gene_type:complete
MHASTSSSLPLAHTLRALAALISYPDQGLREHLDELRSALRGDARLSANRLAEVEHLIDLLDRRAGLDSEAVYVDLFDRGRGTSLHLFEHVHGDSRDRGPAMIDLVQTYVQAGLMLDDGELPDYLPVALEYASTQPLKAATAFLGEIAHIVQVIFSALQARKSPYAAVPAALLDLAGRKAEAVPVAIEPDLDESWAEPAAFAGCSHEGQAAPGQEQAMQIVRKARPGAVHAGGLK